jgi:hypothetical protein
MHGPTRALNQIESGADGDRGDEQLKSLLARLYHLDRR